MVLRRFSSPIYLFFDVKLGVEYLDTQLEGVDSYEKKRICLCVFNSTTAH